MIPWTSMWFRVLVLAVMSFPPTAILWPVGSASGQPPVFQGSFACPPGAPTGQQVGQGLLNALTDPQKGDALNTAWQQAAPNIPKTTITLDRVHVPDGCANGGSDFCSAHFLTGCSFTYVNMELQSLTGVAPLRFTTNLQTANQRNVATGSTRGPDASVIIDRVFGKEGSDAADPAYAVVLPGSSPSTHNGVNGAIVIDLGTKPDGSLLTVCGVTSTCPAPLIQADNDDVYQFDYSTDGVHWTTNAALQFPTPSGSGLRTRSLTNSKAPASFQARYVRVYGVVGTGGNNWSISELQFWDTSKNPIFAKSAVGPLPYEIFDGQTAPKAGWNSADSNYSVVLPHKTGSSVALNIDLGKVWQICGSNALCPHPPRIEADNDDTYMFDYSIDGKNWTTYGYMDQGGNWHGTFSGVGGTGLQQRDVTCSSTPGDPASDASPCALDNKGFSAQYIRVYTRSGGDTFAVSELMLWDTAGNPIPATKQTSGNAPLFVNGEFAPNSTSWDDTHWATKLGNCDPSLNANSKCPPAASNANAPAPKSAAKQIDLTALFPISQITIQADSNDTYQVDGSPDGVTWTNLWGFGHATSGGGLQTRQPKVFSGTLPQARYVRVYATEGDGDYSVSELQIFTPVANTAGAYTTAADNQDFTWSDGRANDGQNFVCSYDGTIATTLGVDNGGTVPPFQVLPIEFFVESVSLWAHGDDGKDHNIASATNRQCNMTLIMPPPNGLPFTDTFQAGLCSSGSTVLSDAQFDESDGSNSAIQFLSKDQPVPYPSGHPSDLQCSDFGSLDAHIPDVLRGFVPPTVAGTVKSVLNQLLDYHVAGRLLPFPAACSDTTVGEPPAPAPDNIRSLSGHATGVGDDRSSATVRISGRFTPAHALALDEAAVTVLSLLHEAGVGDAVQGQFPLSLQPLNGSKADKGLYRTPPGGGPIVSAQVVPVKSSQDGSMDFELEVKNATIREPGPCREGAATAPLTTSFLIVGGSAEPVWVHAAAEWQCNDTQLLTP